MTKKTQEQYDAILAFMENGRWYKANELTELLGVKETRTKMLLRALVADKKLDDNGVTKGKTYRKVTEKSDEKNARTVRCYFSLYGKRKMV